MDKAEKRENRFNRFQSFVMHRMAPSSLMEEDDLLYWRVRILFSLLFAGSVLTFIAMIPVAILVIKENAWILGLFDAAVWLVAIILLLSRNIRFETRSTITLVINYLLGLVIIANVGFLSGGTICLFGFAVLTGIFKGTKAVTVALAVNALTLAVSGWLMYTGRLGQTFPFFKSLEAMMAAGTTFMLMNAVVAISVRVLVKGLAITNQKQKALVEKLENEHARLENTKIMLEMEIQERKQAEEALRESEARWKFALEGARDGVWDWDTVTNKVYFSDQWKSMLGYAGHEIGNTVDEWDRRLHPEDKAAAYADLERHFRRETETYQNEHRLLCKDGSYKWILDRGKVIEWTEDGKPRRVIGTHTDIEDRRRAEEALRESEEIFRQFMDNSPIYVFFKDENIRAIRLSRNYEKMLGRPVEEMLGKSMDDLFPSDLAKSMIADDMRILLEGKQVIVEEELNGRFYTTIKFPIFHDGKPRYLAGYTIDVTDRKTADEEKAYLEAQNQQLQKAESLGRMAGAIAHHFNNQLTVVMGNLELAMAALSRGDRPAKYLADSMQSARKAAKMSELMLTYLGQTPGKHEPLDLSEVSRQSLPILLEAMPKNVALNTDISSPGPTISADANQVQQVITNLVTNAWEAIDGGGGAIKLTVKTVFPPDMPLSHNFPIDWKPLDNIYACIEVSDTGSGIAGRDIEKIFDPFFSIKFTGRGLGLAVVLGIMKSHGGAVNVESEPGRGSIFRAFFPVSKQLPLVFKQQVEACEIPMLEGGSTVLLIEDEEAVRKMAKSMLALMGHAVYEAKDGFEAVDIFRRHKEEIRVVLCDLTMPRLDGWGTLSALRNLDRGIPVILASGYDKEKVMTGDHPEWPQVFLNKPYDMKELGDALNRAVAKKV
jgi:PAS domain S-box-containing protein